MCAQVIRESMRMFPVGGSGIGRYADRDVELGGYLIPKGTEVAVCLYTMHNVPWNFPDPDTFKPDRWLTTVEEGGAHIQIQIQTVRDAIVGASLERKAAYILR